MGHTTGINHDQSEPRSKMILLWVSGLTAVLVIVILWSIPFYRAFASREMGKKEISGPTRELRNLNAYEQEQLNTLKWIDEKKGTIQIPINSAMDRVAESYL